jgi:hypothetical protein
MAGARPIVDPPAFTSLPYGLWQTAQQPTAPAHWRNGITYIERCPVGGTTYDECVSVTGTGAPPPPEPKTANVTQDFRGATPITVFARFDCSPVGLSDIDTVASEALARVEESQLEAAFWTGSAGGTGVVFPHLAADGTVEDAQGITLQSAASVCITGVDAAHGLGVLEQCLDDCYDGQGVLHVPRLALATLDAWGLVRGIDGTLRTLSGNLVAVGGGYPNTGPNGTAAPAGTAWIYATGAVFGYRSDVFATQVRDSLDRAENTVEMLAERTYVMAWECCHLAALINLGVPED